LSPSSDIRQRFDRMRAELELHPAALTAAETFESAARSARLAAARCLPLGLALVMHLYPLCVLRCVSLPWFSQAGIRRARLLHDVDSRALILANAGSERTAGGHCVTLHRARGGVRVDGTYDYVSLAHIADLVLFSAPLADGSATVFCAADLRAPSVRIGGPRFSGSMSQSDTCSVTFVNHPVPAERMLVVPNESALNCMTRYQRSWFHLLIAESYVARIAQLHLDWDLPRTPEQIASLNELALLRSYSLRLLGDAATRAGVDTLGRVTAALKLRASWLAQATAALLRARDDVAAQELGYLRLQPTSDDRILRSLGAA
jgi:alkylation response protein AidB-like acyl-CoA dehydrogenase